MSRRMGRGLYMGLLRLHPRGFRREAENEMLRIFDEASESFGVGWLLRDAVVSLVRQRLLRSGQDEATAVAEVRLLAGAYPDSRAPHLTLAKLSLALVLSMLSIFLFPPREPISEMNKRKVSRVHRESYYGKPKLR